MEVIKMILEAKRLFAVEMTFPKMMLHEHNITKEEVYFWFNTLYKEQTEKYKDTIENMF